MGSTWTRRASPRAKRGIHANRLTRIYMPTFKRQDQEQIEKAQDLLEGAPVGEIGFTKSLFFGRLHLDKVMPYPKQDPEESARVDNLLRDLDAFLTAHVDPERIDREERISQ